MFSEINYDFAVGTAHRRGPQSYFNKTFAVVVISAREQPSEARQPKAARGPYQLNLSN